MSAAPIVVGGEALYDLVAGPGDEAATLAGHAGGGPFNVARTIGRLRRPVAFLGRLSTDRLGATHARMLADDGVSLECVVRCRRPDDARAGQPRRGRRRELRLLHRLDGRGRADGRRRPWRRCRRTSRRCTSARSASCSSRWRARWRPSSSGWRAPRWSSSTSTAGRRRSPIRRSTASGWPASSRYSDLVKASEEDLGWLRPGQRAARRGARAAAAAARARCCSRSAPTAPRC